jgi:hypothetical protein
VNSMAWKRSGVRIPKLHRRSEALSRLGKGLF